MLKRRGVPILVAIFFCSSMLFSEEVIWRLRPLPGFHTLVADRVILSLGPGPINSDYALSQVLVECAEGEPRIGLPGTINAITTFFQNDAKIDFKFLPGAVFNPETRQFEIPGQAILNVFTVIGPADLPTFLEDPDLGILLNVNFIQNIAENWIEVTAVGLTGLPLPIQIDPDVRYFVGLTPLFPSAGAQPFSGTHITNATGFGTESQSAIRQTAPVLNNWSFAGNVFGPPPELFATITLNGPASLKLGDTNMDGFVDLLDVDPFVDLLSGGGYQKEADINGDGFVNLLDVDPFVDILSGI